MRKRMRLKNLNKYRPSNIFAMRWTLVKQDFKTGETTCTGVFGSKFEALDFAEKACADYIRQRQGDDADVTILQSGATGRPFAYFAQWSDRINDQVDVRHKFVAQGWVRSSVVVETVFSLTPLALTFRNGEGAQFAEEVRKGRQVSCSPVKAELESFRAQLAAIAARVRDLVPVCDDRGEPQSDHAESADSDLSADGDVPDTVSAAELADDLSELSE